MIWYIMCQFLLNICCCSLMIKILIRSRDVYHETQNKLLIVLDAKCYAQVKILKKCVKYHYGC